MATRCRDRAPRDRNKEPLPKKMPVKYAPVTKVPTKLSPFYLGGVYLYFRSFAEVSLLRIV